MNNSILNVGVLGYADVFKKHMNNAFHDSRYFKVKKLGTRKKINNVDLEKLTAEGINITTYDGIICDNEIDVVYIPLPNSMHFEWICKAIECGKHVLVEKPITLTKCEFQQIVNIGKSKNLLIKQNFMFEYHAQFKFIQNEILTGRIGELRSIRSSFGFPPFEDQNNIRYNQQLGGGSLNDAGAYGIKISTLLLDFSDSFSVFSGLNIDKVKNVDLFGSAYLIDKNGVHAHIDFGFNNFYQCELTIWGSKGKITANRIFTAGPGVNAKIVIQTNDLNEELIFKSDNHFLNLLEQFYFDISNKNYESENFKNAQFVDLLEAIRRNAILIYE